MRKIDKSNWHSFFDAISKPLLMGDPAEVEVAAKPLGFRQPAEWVPLLGVVYEDENDKLDVVLEDADVVIPEPRDVYLDETAAGVEGVRVIDGHGAERVIRFRDPLR